jgi:hypothetical protein
MMFSFGRVVFAVDYNGLETYGIFLGSEPRDNNSVLYGGYQVYFSWGF